MLEPKPSKVMAVGAASQLWKLYRFPSARELVLEDLALALGVLVIEGRLDTADARLVRSGPRVRVRDVGEPGAGGRGGLVEGGLTAAAARGGTHPRILGGGGYRSPS